MTLPLTDAPLFSVLAPAESAALSSLFHAVMLEPDQVLFEQGKPCDWLWVLGPGAEVTVTSWADAPAQVVVAHLRAGDTVGEMALVDEGPRSGTARVTVGGPASVMAARDFYALRDAYHPGAFQLLRKICLELCGRLRGTTDRLVPPARGGPAPLPALVQERAEPEHLDQVPALQALPRVVKLALAQKLTRIDLGAGAAVCVEGQAGDAAYFLASGEVQVMRGEHTLARLGPGEVFGMVALMDGGPRSATCVTAAPTRLFRLARADFEQLFAAGNRFAFRLVDGMARQLVRNLRTADVLLAHPEASVQPLAVAPGALFSDDELAALEFGDLADSLGPATPPA